MLAVLTGLSFISLFVGFSRLPHQTQQTDLSSWHTALTHFHSLLCIALCTDALLSHAHSGTSMQTLSPNGKELSELHSRARTETISSLDACSFVLLVGSLTLLPEVCLCSEPSSWKAFGIHSP